MRPARRGTKQWSSAYPFRRPMSLRALGPLSPETYWRNSAAIAAVAHGGHAAQPVPARALRSDQRPHLRSAEQPAGAHGRRRWATHRRRCRGRGLPWGADPALRIVLAVGLAITVMGCVRAVHPPCGAVAMVAAMNSEAVQENGLSLRARTGGGGNGAAGGDRRQALAPMQRHSISSD